MILIVSHPGDVHVPAVVERLVRLGALPVLLDLASLPGSGSVTVGHATDPGLEARLTLADGVTLRAQDVHAVWWRRPRPYELQAGLEPEHARFALVQLHEAMTGLWSAMPARWFNQPWSDQQADHKLRQLLVAERAGLDVPRTVVTSAPADARAFLDAGEGMRFVRKLLRPSVHFSQPTRLLSAADVARLDALRLSPAIIQEYVEGVDLRVTVVGDELFAAEIDARRTASPQDFRPVYAGCRVAAAELPEPVADGVRRLVATLGLSYAAIDLRRTGDGRHLFLEVNPAGQWLFVEQRTGQPISEALARALAGQAA